MSLAQKQKLTFEERELIRKVMKQLESGLRIAGTILSEEEISLVLNQSFERERIILIQNFL